jgi:hypothetical protein
LDLVHHTDSTGKWAPTEVTDDTCEPLRQRANENALALSAARACRFAGIIEAMMVQGVAERPPRREVDALAFLDFEEDDEQDETAASSGGEGQHEEVDEDQRFDGSDGWSDDDGGGEPRTPRLEIIEPGSPTAPLNDASPAGAPQRAPSALSLSPLMTPGGPVSPGPTPAAHVRPRSRPSRAGDASPAMSTLEMAAADGGAGALHTSANLALERDVARLDVSCKPLAC